MPNTHLMPYQQEGVAHALKFKNAFIADEMGLGKTIQAIAYINARNDIRSVLVICPLSLKLNWLAELDRWLDRKERCTVSVIHYDAMHRTSLEPADLLIIDEAHYIKNPKSLRCQAVQSYARKAKHVLILTGTPFENKPLELWPLLQILDPKTWDPAGYIYKGKEKIKVGAGEGANFFSYAKRYCGGVKKQTGIDRKTRKPVYHWDFNGASHLDELKRYLDKTGYIRRLKKDVLPQLPEKTRQVIIIPPVEEEPSQLQVFRDEMEVDNYTEVIAKLHASKVAFAEWSATRRKQGIAKVDWLVEHITNCVESGKEKIILFTHHIEVTLELAKKLVFLGCTFMTSEMSSEERQSCVDVFNDDPNCKVIIGSMSVMGVGFNMNITDLVVFGEVDPVPGKLWQSEDRGHRFGRERGLHIQYPVFDRSIEARICQIVVMKKEILDFVLG